MSKLDEMKFLAESNAIEGYNYDTSQYMKYVKPRLSKNILDNYLLSGMIDDKRLITQSKRTLRLAKKVDILTESDILRLHSIMIEGFLAVEHIGVYRNCSVRVGNYVPPSYNRVPNLMNEFIDAFNKKELSPLELHYMFESIHPFVDGNGRLGRILWAMDLHQRKQPIYNILDTYDIEYESNNLYSMIDMLNLKRQAYYTALDNYDGRK